MWRWIQPETLRYYQADLVVDLFGDWTLVYAWGGLGAKRGSRRIKGMASKEEGLRQVAELDTYRRKRGYLPVETFSNWRSTVIRMRKRIITTTKQRLHRGNGLSQELDFG